ncbi:MAG TPA: sialidase family protein [Candidatus Limnocylindrales bacterium]|nr:sialidase family protein [Candidatus Limnocylindrales bacterium]
MRIRYSLFGAVLILFIAAPAAPQRIIRPEPVIVSQPTPFPLGCNAPQTGTVYENGPVEPYVAVDPKNPLHLVGAWQQDRWSNGGSNGSASAVSFDGGITWSPSLAKFSKCAGGVYDRASDPWVSIAADGTVHQVALGLNGAGRQTAIVVSRSFDGGLTWTDPFTVHFDPAGGDDKEAIVADPNDPRYVYLVWDRPGTAGNNRIVTMFSRSADGGATWSTPAITYDPGNAAFATYHEIGVLPAGRLVDVFELTYNPASGHTPGTWVAASRSDDHGATWDAPTIIAADNSIGTVNAKTQAALRTGSGLSHVAVDSSTGAIYVVWADARFSGGAREGVALSRSTDGGVTWSEPAQVNRAPGVQAFTPAVAAANGRLAVSYFDFREDVDDPAVLLANAWRVFSTDAGTTWTEAALAGPFDMQKAPAATNQHFLGDYQGLVPSRTAFLSFFTVAGDAATPSRVVAVANGRRPAPLKSQRTEVNLNPRPFDPREKPPPRAK